MPPRSSPSITSTTKRAKCLSGSHSSTDGGRRNAVRRSKSRKLLIAIKPPFGANQWRDSSENQRRWVKSDRLLGAGLPVSRWRRSRDAIVVYPDAIIIWEVIGPVIGRLHPVFCAFPARQGVELVSLGERVAGRRVGIIEKSDV